MFSISVDLKDHITEELINVQALQHVGKIKHYRLVD